MRPTKLDPAEVQALTPSERAAIATRRLMLAPATTRQLSDSLSMSPSGTRRLLCRLSRVIPLAQDGSTWSIVDADRQP